MILKKTSSPDIVDIVIKVEEKSTASFNINIGFSTADGPGGTIKFVESNFLGKGQSFSIMFHKAATTFSTGLGFSEPNFMGSAVDAGFDLSASSENNTKAILGKRDNTIPYNTKRQACFIIYELRYC